MQRLNFIIDTPFSQFHSTAIARIRAKCHQIKDFEEGAIGALYVPTHPDAFRWLGLPIPEEGTQGGANDNSYVIRVESVVKGGSMIRAAGWRHLPELKPVDCGAFVMQKLFACLRAMRTGNGFASDQLPDPITIEGQYNGKGAIGYLIVPWVQSSDGKTGSTAGGLMVIYGVSGATGIEDEWCAHGSARTVLTSCNSSQELRVFYNNRYDPRKVVREGKISFCPKQPTDLPLTESDQPQPAKPSPEHAEGADCHHKSPSTQNWDPYPLR